MTSQRRPDSYKSHSALRRAVALAVSLAAVISLVAGCSLFGPKTTTVSDDAGRQVQLTGQPERVVSMAPSNAEILFALGLGDRVVGVTNYDNYPAETATKEKVGDAFNPNYEKITALKPDLVLAVGTAQSQIVQKLEGYKVKVMVLNAKKVRDVLADITLVGKITGTTAKAAEITGAMDKKLNDIQAKVAAVPAEQRPTVFWALDNTLYTVGPGSFVDDLITLAGGRNIAADAKQDYPQFSQEELLARDPDVIVIPLLDESMKPQFKAIKGWDKLKAVKTNRVYFIDPDIVSRPGPRITAGVEEVAKMLHPDLFK
ncbi:MAG: ABC transporter substrate-binding protein [Bacillota bacterium]